MRLILKQGFTLALAGILLGGMCAWGLAGALSSLLFEIKPHDVVAYMAAAVLFCAVALAACLVPARRATHIDPMVALHYE
jgi:putative ABC transport system permease protein